MEEHADRRRPVEDDFRRFRVDLIVFYLPDYYHARQTAMQTGVPEEADDGGDGSTNQAPAEATSRMGWSAARATDHEATGAIDQLTAAGQTQESHRWPLARPRRAAAGRGRVLRLDGCRFGATRAMPARLGAVRRGADAVGVLRLAQRVGLLEALLRRLASTGRLRVGLVDKVAALPAGRRTTAGRRTQTAVDQIRWTVAQLRIK